jgi:glutamate racemase
MIGFFDSGFGGLIVLKGVRKKLPDYSYIYLGDNDRAPYGSRCKEEIFWYTAEGVEELFRRGAKLVVLACNTSSAVALRRLQREWLPETYPDKKVLGIFCPTVEYLADLKVRNVGIFATEATVSSEAYIREIGKVSLETLVVQQACPLLVPLIESGKLDRLEITVKNYADGLLSKNKKIEAVILGCTHYATIENIFRRHIPESIKIISQEDAVAKSLENYLARHEEVESMLKRGGDCEFLTTGNSAHI